MKGLCQATLFRFLPFCYTGNFRERGIFLISLFEALGELQQLLTAAICRVLWILWLDFRERKMHKAGVGAWASESQI